MNVWAVVPAAGSGQRMGVADCPKVLLELSPGVTVLQTTVKSLLLCPLISGVVVVIPDLKDEGYFQTLGALEDKGRILFVGGGPSRQDSVYQGLSILDSSVDLVVVHDAARPFCPPDLVNVLIEEALKTGAAIAAKPVTNTLKEASVDLLVKKTVPREGIWEAQTPQVFRTDVILKAHSFAKDTGFLGTDESALVEHLGHPVSLIKSDGRNLKITFPEDLDYARYLWGNLRN